MASCPNPNANNQVGDSNLPALSPSKIFNYYKLSRYNRLIDSIIGDIFRNYVSEFGWTIKDLQNPDNLRRVYKGVEQYMKNMLIDKYNPDTQSKWDGLSNSVAADIDTIVENFPAFANEHIKFSEIFSTKAFDINEEISDDTDASPEDESDIDDVDDEEKDLQGDKFDERTSNSQSQVDLTSNAVRTMFRLISKAKYNPLTKKGEILYDKDGLPQPADFMKTWNLLASKLAGEKNDSKFIDILTSEKTKQIIPEVDQIIDILKVDKTDKSYSEVVQFVQFWQTFSKPIIPLKSGLFGPSSEQEEKGQNLFSLNDEILGNREKIEIIFNNNFNSNNVPEDYKKYIKRSTTGVYMLDKATPQDNNYIPPMDGTFESQLKFLSFLGFQFSFLHLLDAKDAQKFRDVVATASQRLYSSLKKRLEDGVQIKTPINEMRKRFGKSFPETKSIRDLIEWESQYSQIAPTHSSRTAKGELQYLINNDSALSMASYHLNSAKTLDELFTTSSFLTSKYDPLFRPSWTISFLFDENGKKREGRTVDLNLLSGFKIKEGAKTTTQLERDLSERNKLVQDYNMFLSVGRTDTMRTETSRSFFSVGVYEGGDPVKALEAKGFSTGFTKYKGFNSQILKYLNGEISRIQSYSKKKQENPSLPEGYGDFSIFSEISQQLKDKLKVSPTLEYANPLFQEFLSEYNRILEDEMTSFKLLLSRNKITSNDLLSKQLLDIGESVDTLHRAFIAGTILQSIEFSILFAGDPLFYENEKKGISEMAKRLKGLASTGSISADLAILRSYFNGNEEKNYRDRYSLSSALGVKRRDNIDDFRTQTLAEPISAKNGYTSPSLITNMKKSWNMRDGSSISDEEIRNLIKDGADIKVADGQGWIDIDSYREFAIKFGFISPEIETALKYEGLLFKRDISSKIGGKELTPDEERELVKLEGIVYKDPDKYTIPVIKGTYWGPIINTTVNGKAYDKFSIAPILPSHARNHPVLKEFMLDLVRGQYGYVKYESGTKGWKTQPTSSLKDVKPDLYATQLFKEQIKTKSKQSTEVTMLTQQIKLAFTNLFSTGKSSDRVQQLYSTYLKAFNSIRKEQRERIGKDLGMTINENEEKYDINDPAKLSAKLIREVKRQGGDSDLIKALSINPVTGNFNGALDASGFQKEINQLVSGILDRTLRRFKFAGGDFVLESNHMQSPLRWYQFNPNGQTRPMDVKVNLTKEYLKLLNKLHPDGEEIGTIERLNKLLKNEEWKEENSKSLTVTFGRAPVDGPHSTGVGIISEFLPSTMGNVLIVPEEMIFQASWDFDYDKIRVITPYLDEKGNYLTSSHQERRNQIQDKVTELEKSYPELRRLLDMSESEIEDIPDDELGEDSAQSFIDNLFSTSARRELFLARRENKALVEEYRSLLKDISSLRNNKLLELLSEATLLPEMYAELVSPNTIVHIREIAMKNGENTHSSIELPRKGRNFYYSEQLKIFKTFFDNKNLLAAFAYDNAFQQLLAYSGVNINETYNTKKAPWAPWKPTKINNLLLSDEEYEKVVKEGKILTSLRDDLQEYVKQRWNSEGLNATVDAAKDPFTVLLKILLQNVGVVNVLKHIGVPFERIVHFISNPSLQYYFKLRESGLDQRTSLERLNRDRLFLRSIRTTKRWVQDKDEYNAFMTLSKEELRLFKKLQPDQEFRIIQTPTDPQIEFISYMYPNASVITDMLGEIDDGKPVSKSGYNREGDLINLNKYINHNQITPDRLKFLANPDNDRLVVKDTPSRKSENEGIFSDELRILAHFLALEKVAWAMRDFRNYFNFDTRKTSTLTDIYSKTRLKDKILSQNLFDKEAMNRMEKNTIHGAYMNDDLIAGIFRKMFPFLANPTVLSTFSDIAGDYDSNFQIRNKKDLRNLPYIINNDFLSSILFNYGEFNGRNIFNIGFPLLIRQDKSETMADKLENFKKQSFYKQLRDTYPILDLFVTDKELFQTLNDPNGLPSSFLLESIQLLKNPQETAMEKEGVREQLRDLYYNYDGENTAEVKEFLDNLFITGLVQSGFSKSFISYAEYIPYDFKQPLIFGAMKTVSKLSGDQLSSYMGVFNKQFHNNNRRYFPKLLVLQENGQTKPEPNPVKYAKKFKYYKQNRPPQPPQSSETETVSPETPSPKLPENVVPLQDMKKQITFVEDQSTGYTNRTRQNASADITIAIAADFSSAGERLTEKSAKGQSKLYIPVDAATATVFEAMSKKAIEIADMIAALGKKEVSLNIAGNGIYTMKNVNKTQERVDEETFNLINAIAAHLEAKGIRITSIRTGGQTGYDEAGAKAGRKLGIPTTILAPKGWKFRDINGKDISNEEQFKSRFNINSDNSEESDTQTDAAGNTLNLNC